MNQENIPLHKQVWCDQCNLPLPIVGALEDRRFCASCWPKAKAEEDRLDEEEDVAEILESLDRLLSKYKSWKLEKLSYPDRETGLYFRCHLTPGYLVNEGLGTSLSKAFRNCLKDLSGDSSEDEEDEEDEEE